MLRRTLVTLVTLAAALAASAAWAADAPQTSTATPQAGFTVAGTWSYSSLPGHAPGKGSLWSNEAGATATWNPHLQSPGPIRTSFFVVAHPTNPTDARIEIVHAGRTDSVEVDLRTGPPHWQTLGVYRFAGQGNEYVRLSHGKQRGNLRAAALKLEILDAQNSDMVWQTLVLDDLIPIDVQALKKTAPRDLRGGPPAPEHWELAFSDDFSGRQLDPQVWESAQGESWGSLLSARFPENAVVGDGLLRLVTRKEDRGGKHWTTAMISTRSFRQQYGYWEARYRYAAASGLNQAFWMHARQKEKAQNFEIDVNEGHYPCIVNATLHQGGMPSQSKRYLAQYDLAADFHVYGCLWNAAEVAFYFDGQEIQRLPNTKGHLPVPVIFSTAVLPNWAGPVTDALDGKSMDVDWVKVWKMRE